MKNFNFIFQPENKRNREENLWSRKTKPKDLPSNTTARLVESTFECNLSVFFFAMNIFQRLSEVIFFLWNRNRVEKVENFLFSRSFSLPTFSVLLTFCKAGHPGTTSANDGRRAFESRFTLRRPSWSLFGFAPSFPVAWRKNCFRFLLEEKFFFSKFYFSVGRNLQRFLFWKKNI